MNKDRVSRKFAAACGALLVAFLLSSCAATGPAGDNDIAERAQARWDALLENDFATAYSYLSPGYQSGKSVVDYEIDMRMKKVRYLNAQYLSHECENDVCTVNVKVEFSIMKPVPGVQDFEGGSVNPEQWIKSNNNWWYLPQN